MTAKMKDPGDDVIFTFDWSRYLADLDAIEIAVVDGAAGLTVGDVHHTTTQVTVRVSGGTAGNTYDITCAITTTGGNSVERTRQIRVVER